ncbi:FKBP-type peptidyl-prolyl cis-trans isomerase [bacterium BD-1]|uniref:FKBP-type peptidyl-prolyl cis-trans isomerase n=1 Tax=Arenimonas sp. TaxID=1872635 RepID=UPI001E608A29|nr:FKBP-type peptidyl-prolyl cis-trans isomerase [Ottowia caeni]
MNSALRFAAPLVLASLVLSLSACKSETTDEAAPAAETAAAGEPGAPIIPGIAGLETERAQVSYMIGRDIANSMKIIKDDLDLEILRQAMEDTFQERDSKLTDEQMKEIQAAFTTKLQARQAAEAAELAAKSKAEGEAFLAENKGKPGVQVTESGLQYRVERAGNGATPTASDVVRVHYKGTLLNGETFDSSYDRGEPAEFGLGQVIPGWSEGVQLMKVGSKYTFWIPAELAYGEAGGGPIPANAMLTFEVELMEIVK